MKRNHLNRRSLLSLFAVLFMAITFSNCSDDNEFFQNEFGSSLEIKDGYKLSKFVLEKDLWILPDSIHRIRVTLQAQGKDELLRFETEIKYGAEGREFIILIPKDQTITDDDYTMRGYQQNNMSLDKIFKVTFTGEMISAIHASEFTYPLKGSGTEEDPYKIESTAQYKEFRRALSEDTNHGAGYTFLQSNNITLQGENYEYETNDFAGRYDGGGFSITYDMNGTSKVGGLYNELLDGADIKNLDIHAHISNLGSNVGGLAGKISGNVTLTDVKVFVEFVGGENSDTVGGLIGYSSGNVNITRCSMQGSIKGNKRLGGLIGQQENGRLFLSEIVVNNEVIIQGEDYVGGLIGFVQDAMLRMHTILFTPKKTAGEVNIQGVWHVGGIFGYADVVGAHTIWDTLHSEFSQIRSSVNIKARGNAGGIGGYMKHTNYNMSFIGLSTFDSNIITGNIDQDNCSKVGGLFGWLDATWCSSKFFDSSNPQYPFSATNTSVSGTQCVGLLVGYSSSGIEFDGSLKIDLSGDVFAKEEYAGGAFGCLRYSEFNVDNFTASKDLTVKGGHKVGGLIGFANNCNLNGNVSKMFFPSVVSRDHFKSTFNCEIGDRDNLGSTIGGFVGYAEECKMKGLCFGGNVYGTEEVGGIVGSAFKCRMEKCVNIGKTIQGNSKYVGGLVGFFRSAFIVHDYMSPVPFVFKNLLNYADVVADNAHQVGGIVGRLQTSERENEEGHMKSEYLVNNGNVTGNTSVGGCIGVYMDNNRSRRDGNDSKAGIMHLVDNSANFKTVTSRNAGHTGGIIGKVISFTFKIRYSVNHGDIYANTNRTDETVQVNPDDLKDDNSSVGGLVGLLGYDADPSSSSRAESTEMRECCNFGTIRCEHDDTTIGGLIGRKEEGGAHDDKGWWEISDNYNAGDIPSTANKSGAISGYYDWNNKYYRFYNIGNLAKGDAISGHSKTASSVERDFIYIKRGSVKSKKDYERSDSEMQSQSTYVGFNFKDVWTMDDANSNYPVLRHCPFQFTVPE